MAKIAIGIPAYNEEQFIAQTLVSAIQQFEHYSDLEILISDNNSEDETVSEIEKTIEASKPKNGCIKLLKNKKNKGAASNFWQVFDKSDSEFFMWLGSHDLISEKYIFHGIDHMIQNQKTSMFCGTHRGLTTNEKIIEKHFPYSFCQENPIERYLSSLIKLQNCYIFHSIFRRNTLAGYSRTEVPSGDHILISRWLWSGRLHQSSDCVYFRRYFNDEKRQQNDTNGSYVHNVNNIEFFDAYLTDLNRLSSSLPETVQRAVINLASDILLKRFGMPFVVEN